MQNNLSKLFSFFTIFVLVLFSGCAKYKPRPLFECKGLPQEKDNLVVRTAKLSKDECDFAFDDRFASSRLQPVQIMVENKGTQPVELHSSRIGLDIEAMKTLKRTAHFNTLGRTFGYGLLGLGVAFATIIPAACIGYLCNFSSGGFHGLAFPIFAMPIVWALGGGCNSAKMNKKMDKDFAKRTIVMGSRITIAPQAIMNRVMFVSAESYIQSYDIEFVNLVTQKVTQFNCSL